MKTLIPLLLLLATLATGCASDVVAPEESTYHVTPERNGQTVRVPLGDKLAILLPIVAGSPMHWTPTISNPAVVSDMLGRTLISPRVGGTVIGGAQGYERLEFRTLQTGATDLRVRRTGADGKPALFEIRVVVLPPAGVSIQ